MIRITNIRIEINGIIGDMENKRITGAVKEEERSILYGRICKLLHTDYDEIKELVIERKSIDARKKNEIYLVYTIIVRVKEETRVKKKVRDKRVSFIEDSLYGRIGNKNLTGFTSADIRNNTPISVTYKKNVNRPVIVGMGPAGLFCAYHLAKMGLRPILLERGMDVDARVNSVYRFWETNVLDVNSNVQFGEGGAGTFSDGKLNTLVKDAKGRNRMVLSLFVEHGAPPEIAYLAKPHIGTDRLRSVVKNIREGILALGGEVRFLTKLDGIKVEDGRITGCYISKTHSAVSTHILRDNGGPLAHMEVRTEEHGVKNEFLPCSDLVLAIGHSARDTFQMLYKNGVEMTSKAFAIGVRIEHLQSMVNASQYGKWKDNLPPADYRLTHRTKEGRGVYSFCMCPGGFVVNASSEKDGLAINGMSNYNRGEQNANSAIVVTVSGEDFRYGMENRGSIPEALLGMEFQRKYERLAYRISNGLIPVQKYGDFKKNGEPGDLGLVIPNIKGRYKLANVRECLPVYVGDAIVEGIRAFDKKINGFGDSDAVISGVETRTSSPVRILRDESLQSNIKGLYPCGEGAGYAGGITSAAMDGLKVAEAVMKESIQ